MPAAEIAGDVAMAAVVRIVSHGDMLRCASRAQTAVDAAIRAAQKIGALGPIIRAAHWQQRRQRGAQGRRAPSYNATMTRLRDALLKAAVHGPLPPVEQLILRVMPAANDRVPRGHSVD